MGFGPVQRGSVKVIGIPGGGGTPKIGEKTL